jgi:hypothetical protein
LRTIKALDECRLLIGRYARLDLRPDSGQFGVGTRFGATLWSREQRDQWHKI